MFLAVVSGEYPRTSVVEGARAAGVELVRSEDRDSAAVSGYVMNSFGPVEPAPADRELLDRHPTLRIVVYQGQSLEQGDYVRYADLDVLRQRGIALATTPAGDAVAEAALGLLIAADLNLGALIAGDVGPGSHTGLAGSTLGIVGLGQIGTRLAELAKAIGMRVAYASRARHVDSEDRLKLDHLPLAELFGAADFVSIHVANSAPPGLISAAEVHDANDIVLINNTSAPRLVDPGSLLAALRAGRVRRAVVEGRYPPSWQLQLEQLGVGRYLHLPAYSSWDTPRARAAGWQGAIDALAAAAAGSDIPYRLV